MKECAKLLVILFTSLVVQCSAMSVSELEDFANFLKKTSQLDETLKKGTDVNDFDEDEAVSDHAWEESGKFEGDLILNERQRRMIVEDIAEGLSRNGLRDSTKRWPDNEVIYYIQKEHFSSDQVEAIQNGIDDLAQASCIKFRPYRKGDRDAVVIQGSRRGCFSQVGYQGGYQVLNLSGRHPVGRGCFRHGTVVHELLHTLGFYHMQSSPDRDDYVNIAWENIIQPARHNFRKYNAFSVSDFGVGYDYDSVLHYSRGAFSSNGRDTIVPKQGGAQIGQRVGLSDKDTQKLNKMYCDADNNDFASDDVPQKSSPKKKKPKNKPFEGHGIGYHQGKTVVIKLLPSAETYHIINKPAFPMFDYFSKAPQVLSQKENEGFGQGKRIADSYKPSYTYKEDYNEEAPKESQNPNGSTTSIQSDRNPNHSVTETNKNTESDNSAHKISETEQENTGSKSSEDDNDDLSDAFKRLGKIIKTHVYPNHYPDLKPYKINTDYSDYENPHKLPKIAYDFVNITPKDEQNSKELSESDYITSLYRNGPESLRSGIQDHGPERLEKIVAKSNSSKEILSDTEVKEHSPRQGYKNQFRDSADSLNPHIQHKELKKSQDPKVMFEIITNPNISKEAEDAYRTSYPFKTHQVSSNGSIEIITPDYAQYENFKDKNNYSDLYVPHTQEDDDTTEKRYRIFGDSVPLYDDWYQKDKLKRNPVDYDRPSYTYISPGSKSDLRIYDESESSEDDPGHGSKYTGSFSPQTRQAYTLYGEPVPLSQNWYNINGQKLIEYPYNHYQSRESSESHEHER